MCISDSLSALQANTTALIHANHSLVIHIVLLLLQSFIHITINFLWISDHVEIQGNEVADRLAKMAALSKISHKTIPIYEMYSLIEKTSHDDWENQYSKALGNLL